MWSFKVFMSAFKMQYNFKKFQCFFTKREKMSSNLHVENIFDITLFYVKFLLFEITQPT